MIRVSAIPRVTLVREALAILRVMPSMLRTTKRAGRKLEAPDQAAAACMKQFVPPVLLNAAM